MKQTSFLTGVAGLAALLIGASGTWSPLRADIFVIESTAPAIKAGAPLADKQTIALPAGSQIRAILPSGKTQTIKGPYDGTVADLTKGQPNNEGIMRWLRTIMATGGVTESTPGATRSIKHNAPKPSEFSWSTLPVASDGDVCVDRSGKLQLARATGARGDRVTIVDVATSAHAEAQWLPGSDLVAWPEAIPLRADAMYYLLVQDRPRRQITVRILDRLPGDDDILAELHKRGCQGQFETYIRQKIAASKRSS